MYHPGINQINTKSVIKNYLVEIQSVVNLLLYPVLDKPLQIDPHDLVLPESWFHNEDYARGFIWNMFIKRSSQCSSYNLKES